jgi:hypothetical protein
MIQRQPDVGQSEHGEYRDIRIVRHFRGGAGIRPERAYSPLFSNIIPIAVAHREERSA